MLSRFALPLCFLLALVFGSTVRANDVSQPRASRIVSFENEAQVASLAKDGPTVVFFFASWCANCKAAALEFSSKWDTLRPGIALIVADYDKQTALKAKYGVTYQDTYVLVNADGSKRKLWNAGGIAALNANTID
jgi:thiol-disulfide isomerase/thioredoxin